MEKKNKKKNSSKGKMLQKNTKPEINNRFNAMFSDKSFELKYFTDKRGRPIDHSLSKDLKEYYSITSSESEDENEQADIHLKAVPGPSGVTKDMQKQTAKGPKTVHSEKNKTSSELSDDEEEFSAKSDDDETSSDTSEGAEEDSDDEFDHKWGELDADAPFTSESTKRLALCNMDWDRIRVEDVFVVLNSFKPANGVIHSVKIYPSEFGLKRMKEEELHGPSELVIRTSASNEEKEQEYKKGSKYHREKLRQYQLNRLKFYYAVIECDSPETAALLYEQLNGMEYESSGVSIDLRFIPDHITFKEESAQTAYTAPDPTDYRPRLFINSALQQDKVNLTWDETDPKRTEFFRRLKMEPESIEKDIKDYLASSSGSEDEDGDIENGKSETREMKIQDRIANYKALYQSVVEEEEEKQRERKKKYEVELIWDPDLKQKTKEMVKERIRKETCTPFEEKLNKKKEETKQKKKERKMLFKNKASDDSSGSESEDMIDRSTDEQPSGNSSKNAKFQGSPRKDKSEMMGELSLLVSESHEETLARTKHITKKEKRKQKKEQKANADNLEIDDDDGRFSKMYTSYDYNIDPSDPRFKDPKSIGKIMQEKQKRKIIKETQDGSNRLSKIYKNKQEEINVKKFKKDHSTKRQKILDGDSNVNNSIVFL